MIAYQPPADERSNGTSRQAAAPMRRKRATRSGSAAAASMTATS